MNQPVRRRLLYEDGRRFEQALSDLHQLRQIGAVDQANELLREKGPDIRLGMVYEHAQRQMGKLNALARRTPTDAELFASLARAKHRRPSLRNAQVRAGERVKTAPSRTEFRTALARESAHKS